MRPPLTAQDPAGNVPLLILRLIERIVVPRVCPNEWPVFAPHVEQFLQDRLGGIRK
jgi:hypothetical protein